MKSAQDTTVSNLISHGSAALLNNDFDGVDSTATALDALDSPQAQSYSHYFRGVFRNGEESQQAQTAERHLSKAEKLAEQLKDNRLLARIHNARGCRILSRGPYYEEAIGEFNEARREARLAHEWNMEIVAMLNLSEIYRLADDTLGHALDLEILEYTLKEKVPAPLKETAAFHCAKYVLLGAEPIENLDRYMAIIGPNPVASPDIPAFLQAGRYLHNAQPREALAILDTIPNNTYSMRLRVEALAQMRDWSKLVEDAEKFMGSQSLISDSIRDTSALPDKDWLAIQPYYAKALSLTGTTSKAVEVLEEYIRRKSRLDAAQQQMLSGRYRMEYQVARKDALIENRNSELKFTRIILISAITFILIAGVAISWYLRRRNQLYRDLVRQNQALVRRSSPDSLPEDKSNEADDELRISSDVADEIYAKIQQEMKAGIWADPMMSREGFAERIGCNRTYFSKVLKNKAGLTYTRFINEERIRQAVLILSNPDETRTMKEISAALGFSSVSTFYSIFKQQIGLSPAAYRRTLDEISTPEEASEEE
ncbi:MAG: helix-turn-helix transcriptional regulator [Muribaculaceae bacterium]|nr:helix-turn-helix transcriptional regulator [Muribaculaceae bacterium]